MQYLKEIIKLNIIYKRKDLISYFNLTYTDNYYNRQLINKVTFLLKEDVFM